VPVMSIKLRAPDHKQFNWFAVVLACKDVS